VHLAELAALHPLYPELARLDSAIQRLRAPGAEGLGPGGPLPDWARPELVGSSPLVAWPADLWAGRRGAVDAALAEAPGSQDGPLPQDLQLSLDWKTRVAQRQMEDELARARATRSQELSRKATQWTLEGQDRLPGATEGDAADLAARTRRDLDARVEALRQAHEQYLAELARSRREIMEGQIAAAREAAQRAAAQRRRALSGREGDELAEAVSRALQPLDLSQWPGPVSATLPDVTLPASPGAADQSRAAEDAAWQSRRAATVDDLIGRRAETQDRILAATRLAAERAARQRGWRLHPDPADETGRDFTAEVGNALRRLWSKET
jgi:hypothetical protein